MIVIQATFTVHYQFVNCSFNPRVTPFKNTTEASTIIEYINTNRPCQFFIQELINETGDGTESKWGFYLMLENARLVNAVDHNFDDDDDDFNREYKAEPLMSL